jgi:hypothetical protein
MKKVFLQSLILICAFVFSSCKKDVTPPNPITCNPIICNPAPKVTGFKVKKIYVQNYPYCAPSGGAWDGTNPNDHPDLKITMTRPGSTNPYSGNQFYNNPQASWNNLNWVINSVDEFVSLTVLDRDEVPDAFTYQTLLIVNFNGQALIDDPDNTYSVSLNGHSSCYPYGSPSWLRIEFDLLYD